jgi:hypothetical protein
VWFCLATFTAPAPFFNPTPKDKLDDQVFDKVHAVGPVGVRLVRQTTFADGSSVITDSLTAATAPAPKRVPLATERLLARAGIKSTTGKYRVADLDAAFTKAGMSVVDRVRAKAQLVEAGLLD